MVSSEEACCSVTLHCRGVVQVGIVKKSLVDTGLVKLVTTAEWPLEQLNQSPSVSFSLLLLGVWG